MRKRILLKYAADVRPRTTSMTVSKTGVSRSIMNKRPEVTIRVLVAVEERTDMSGMTD